MPKWHVRRLGGAWVAYVDGCDDPSSEGHEESSWWSSWWSAWVYALLRADPAAEVCH